MPLDAPVMRIICPFIVINVLLCHDAQRNCQPALTLLLCFFYQFTNFNFLVFGNFATDSPNRPHSQDHQMNGSNFPLRECTSAQLGKSHLNENQLRFKPCRLDAFVNPSVYYSLHGCRSKTKAALREPQLQLHGNVSQLEQTKNVQLSSGVTRDDKDHFLTTNNFGLQGLE